MVEAVLLDCADNCLVVNADVDALTVVASGYKPGIGVVYWLWSSTKCAVVPISAVPTVFLEVSTAVEVIDTNLLIE
jgi:hypothetical protein